MKHSVSVSAHSRAQPGVLFALLKDGSTWPAWSMFDSFDLERPGEADPMGVGAIRVFSTKYTQAREEVVSLTEGESLTYRLLSGLPLRNYEATVTIVADPAGGSSITWTAEFGPQAFGTAMFWRFFMKSVLQRTANDLAKAGEAQPQ